LHQDSGPTASLVAAHSISNRQRSSGQPTVAAALPASQLEITRLLQRRMPSLVQASLLLQALCPASCQLTITELLQRRTPSLAQANRYEGSFHHYSSDKLCFPGHM
jgi:hypothetical protein